MEQLTFDQYQLKASTTSIEPVVKIDPTWKHLPSHVGQYFHASLGIGEESGEILGKFKKIYRDKNQTVQASDKQEIAKELGDLLWYLSELATRMGYSLNEVANMNLDKLKDRAARGVIGGKGDNR